MWKFASKMFACLYFCFDVWCECGVLVFSVCYKCEMIVFIIMLVKYLVALLIDAYFVTLKFRSCSSVNEVKCFHFALL